MLSKSCNDLNLITVVTVNVSIRSDQLNLSYMSLATDYVLVDEDRDLVSINLSRIQSVRKKEMIVTSRDKILYPGNHPYGEKKVVYEIRMFDDDKLIYCLEDDWINHYDTSRIHLF